jgi:hypothetical protein
MCLKNHCAAFTFSARDQKLLLFAFAVSLILCVKIRTFHQPFSFPESTDNRFIAPHNSILAKQASTVSKKAIRVKIG